MRKWFNISNSVKVSEDESVSSEFCKMDITGYHTKSSFSEMVEIEAKLERDKCIIDKALSIVSVDNSFRSLAVNR